MDPLTLFTLANGAVAAVKAGCKLYKDIKGAAGEVNEVLKDLDSQFHKLYEGKPIPPEAKKQLQQEKARVVELNRKIRRASTKRSVIILVCIMTTSTNTWLSLRKKNGALRRKCT